MGNGVVGEITREDLSVQIAAGNVDFLTTYRFVPGSLSVSVNGLRLGIRGKHFLEDPFQKSFTLTGTPPVLGDEVFVKYTVAYPPT